MSSEWIPVHELLSNGDLLLVQDGNHGGNYPKVDEFVDTGVPLITGACLDRGTIDYSQANFLTKERADMLRVGRALPGDVLLTHKGTMGKTAIVPTSEYPFTVLNPQLTLYRVSPKGKLDRRYLRYYFDSAHFQELLARISSTSTISTLSIREQKQLNIPVPKLATQKSVVDILGSLDDRITLLRATNATLEAIAQALFKSWFVDFDPVRAKMEGRTPEGMDEATAALFPDGFETSELGEVPRGWRVTPFSSIVSVSSGKRPEDRVDSPSSTIAVPLYGGAGVMGYTSSSLFDVPKILTGRVGTLGKVHIAYPPFWASDNVLVVTPKNPLFFSFAYHWLLLIDVTALNRGSTQPLLTQRDLGAQIGVVPPSQVLEAFEGVVASLATRILANTKQADTLSILRDTLLPRLISGQLRLPNAEMEATTA